MSNSIRDTDDLCRALGIQFSDEQLAAITAPLEPAVIIAGAGTGKTTVMAARVVWLVGTGQVRPEEVLGLTFTRKAAQELGGRVRSALERAGVLTGDDTEGTEVISTYDSFAARLVAEFGLRLGLDEDPVMLTGASRYRLAARAIGATPGPFSSITRLSVGTLPDRVLSLDAELAGHLVDPQHVRDYTGQAIERLEAAPLYRGKRMVDVAKAIAACEERLELLDLVEAYQRLKAQLGLVEYGDQLRRAVQLATQIADVATTIRSRFRAVLLDEYQDTSAAQAILLRALFSGEAPPARGFPVTAVGDPNQAIYGWRGAAANNILDFPEMFPRADGGPAPRLPLGTNRRSGQRILDAGNRLAGVLEGSGAGQGTVLVAPEGTPPGAVEAHRYTTWHEELEALVARVLAEHAQGTAWSEMAVLVRRNATLAEAHAVLAEAGVPTEIVGLGGLLHLPEVALVVDMLRLLDDATANAATAALLTSPRWGIGLADLEVLAARARELASIGRDRPEADTLAELLALTVAQGDPGEQVCLLDAVMDPGEAPLSRAARDRVAAFGSELSSLRQHAREPVPELLRRVVTATGLEAELLSAPEPDPSQLSRFLAVARDYVDVDGDGSLSGFLSYLDAEMADGEGLERAVVSASDSVKLLTVHRAKGLEWHTVFVPALNEGTFPSGARDGIWPQRAAALPSPLRGDAGSIPQLRSFDKKGMDALRNATQADHQRSEDRLAYVAATRAKQLLVASGHVWTPGLKRPKQASRYLLAIAEGAQSPLHDPPGVDANPIPIEERSAGWPVAPDPALLAARRQAADLVREAAALLADDATAAELEQWVWRSGTQEVEVAATVDAWDRDIARMLEASRRRQGDELVLPEALSATAVMAMRRDPQRFAVDLLRPMPRQPSRAARLGTSFHDWVQRRFSQAAPLFEEQGPDRSDPGLQRLVEAFERGRFADRQPLAVEVPFLLARSGLVLRGRIDAVYQWDADGFEHLVVDWKTSNSPADPLQLAVYRQAWAESRDLDPDVVGAAFYHVADDRLVFEDAHIGLLDEMFRQPDPTGTTWGPA